MNVCGVFELVTVILFGILSSRLHKYSEVSGIQLGHAIVAQGSKDEGLEEGGVELMRMMEKGGINSSTNGMLCMLGISRASSSHWGGGPIFFLPPLFSILMGREGVTCPLLLLRHFNLSGNQFSRRGAKQGNKRCHQIESIMTRKYS